MASYQIGKVKFDTLTDARAWAYRNIIAKQDTLMPGVIYEIKKDGVNYEGVGITWADTNKGYICKVWVLNYNPYMRYRSNYINQQGKIIGKV